jgi:hypothetical protein
MDGNQYRSIAAEVVNFSYRAVSNGQLLEIEQRVAPRPYVRGLTGGFMDNEALHSWSSSQRTGCRGLPPRAQLAVAALFRTSASSPSGKLIRGSMENSFGRFGGR